MSEEKKFVAGIISDPIDAKYILQNLANNLLNFHNLIEKENLEVRVKIKKSKNSFYTLIELLLHAPSFSL